VSGDLEQIFNEATRLHKSGKLLDAEKGYRDVLALTPDHPNVLHLLGVTLMQQGRTREAIGHMEQAIALTAQAPVPEFHNNIATGLRAAGFLDKAVAHLQKVAELTPDDAVAQFRLGVVLLEHEKPDDAINCLQIATILKTDFAEAHINLGIALKQVGRLQEAQQALRAGLALQPRDAGTHYMLGNVLKDMGKVNDAAASFETAVALDPTHAGAQWNLALAYLSRADFVQGWKTYGWYTKIKGAVAPPFTQPSWDGGDLSGKTLLLYEEHGYGDTFQFVRYAREIRKRAGRVIVYCRPEIARLLAGTPGVDDVITTGQTPPAFDYQAAFFSLPQIMKVDLATIPRDVPYLTAPAALVEAWRGSDVIRPGRNAGIVWRGNKWTDARRVMTAEQAMRLCAMPGFNWVSLQIGAEPAERTLLSASNVKDAGALVSDWADTAALISSLDMVVTVDTAVAHLAGALGKPVWIMLPFVADWRWLIERTDSPWYPTARLFRQPKADDWDAVIAAVAAALKA
jgi:tetratricopeptide (TPR) repeat protein